MGRSAIVHLDPARLRAYMQAQPETDYLLIDVRQPGEYTAAHIPGAYFLPLMEFEARLFDLPADRDLIFYCHSGGRSAAAAALALEAEITAKTIHNPAETAHARIIYRFWAKTQEKAPPFEALFDRLEGRILEGGLDLAEAVDRLAALAPDRPLEIIEMALHIEAAAYDLYRTVAEREALEPQTSEALLAIAQAEKGHIRMLVEAMGRL